MYVRLLQGILLRHREPALAQTVKTQNSFLVMQATPVWQEADGHSQAGLAHGIYSRYSGHHNKHKFFTE